MTDSSRIVAVHRSPVHRVRKAAVDVVELLAGVGVEGDAHAGATVRHRSRAAADPSQPNLRQVHLIGEELIDELDHRGFPVRPGDLGENLTTRGADLLSMPTGTMLLLGGGALVALTGLRNPCSQLDELAPGLMSAVLDRDERGDLVRRCGVMGVVVASGSVRPGDALAWVPPPGRGRPLEPV